MQWSPLRGIFYKYYKNSCLRKTLNKKEIKTENQVWGPPSMSYLVIITLAQKVVAVASLTSENNDIFD